MIAGFQTGPLSRRAVDRRDDVDIGVALADFDPQAAEPAPGLLAQRLQMLSIQVAAVVVERRQHAMNGRLDELLVLRLLRLGMTLANFLRRRVDQRLVIDLMNIVDADFLVDLREQVRAPDQGAGVPTGFDRGRAVAIADNIAGQPFCGLLRFRPRRPRNRGAPGQ